MKKIFLALLAVAAVFTASAQYKAPKIVANGGYHLSPSSGVKHSMSAFKAAQKLKIYASECDVNTTKDGKVLVIKSGMHPSAKAKVKGNVQNSTSKKLLAIPLPNGENISTLEEFLARAAKKPATKLLLDVRPQSSTKREARHTKAVVNVVSNAGMENNVEYMSSRPWICFELAKLAPNSKIYYCGGNYDPLYVKGMGCCGINYNINILKKNIAWIVMAHKLGMQVAALGVNNDVGIRWCIQNGIDIITTDNPVLAKQIVKEMCKKK